MAIRNHGLSLYSHIFMIFHDIPMFCRCSELSDSALWARLARGEVRCATPGRPGRHGFVGRGIPQSGLLDKAIEQLQQYLLIIQSYIII